MSLIQWKPLQTEIEKFFADQAMPAIDLYETKTHVVAEVPLAGVDPKHVQVTIEHNVLNISGETTRKSEVDEKDYYRKEVRYGTFARRVALPAPVLGEKTTAEFHDGMLTVLMPKAEKDKATPININIKN